MLKSQGILPQCRLCSGFVNTLLTLLRSEAASRPRQCPNSDVLASCTLQELSRAFYIPFELVFLALALRAISERMLQKLVFLVLSSREASGERRTLAQGLSTLLTPLRSCWSLGLLVSKQPKSPAYEAHLLFSLSWVWDRWDLACSLPAEAF